MSFLKHGYDISWDAKNKVIRLKIVGKPTMAETMNQLAQLNNLALQKGESGQVRFICDISQAKLGSKDVRKSWEEWLNSDIVKSRISKFTAYGANWTVRIAANFIIRSTGIINGRCFDTQIQALKWLKEKG